MADEEKTDSGDVKVLILGGCGFIGRNLVKYIVDNNLGRFLLGYCSVSCCCVETTMLILLYVACSFAASFVRVADKSQPVKKTLVSLYPSEVKHVLTFVFSLGFTVLLLHCREPLV